MEFHVSRKARDQYQFDQSLFSLNGNVLFANFQGARQFTQKMNEKRDLVSFPEQAVKAGQINAMGLIDEIFHHVTALYLQQAAPQAIQQVLVHLNEALGVEAVDKTLRVFTDEFPPLSVYRREISVDDYLQGETDGRPNREIVIEEMLMLWLANSNPAMAVFTELFDDSRLAKETAYSLILPAVHVFFDSLPTFGPDQQNLIDMLRSPAIAVPYSLSKQLDYIREHWAALLGKYLYRLLSSLDLIKEEEKISFMGPGPVPIPVYRLGAGMEGEVEAFSMDKDWMPNLVLIAKNTYVWLDQLSKEYKRTIDRLDLIPDEELDRLARWGFSGLWLIGVWERSSASAKIKQLTGNPDAVASAYSLAGYTIAASLGGEDAYRNLRDRAWQRGIRLASDMVPNHMGIDSDWVMQHPDWFISLNESPFPSYTFNGPDLSADSRVGIFLEDHYYSRSDAAVVFKRLDRYTGDQKFVYHGNDGTSMPWNDTAQLNYLNPEVREAVIQTILQVAHRFPIIRFDAAMTLAKKHFQRLWYPEPGTGGAIPSRAGLGLTREQFDAAIPVEFWREVVDRVAKEAPDTLLLAEAFWLMEGYFVRTLGMHRVYNSAFMNMLRNEDNAGYRSVMKNTLEFDPEILKRYVNFMNNPDERTAVDQFGKGDKYLGICTLLATLPGLPMFGHGQVQGFSEKYGMEFHKALWDEPVDQDLVAKHEREIFPLLHKRWLFANVEHFLLYDFFTPEGAVNEDVFAYSNRSGNERGLVVYNNRFASAHGWIKSSAAYSVRSPDGSRRLTQKNLADALGLHADSRQYVIYSDHTAGLEYIRSSAQVSEQGLFLDLNAYERHVFMNFREVQDNEWGQYGQLNSYLNGRGVPNMDEAMREVFLQPIHQPFRSLINPSVFQRLIASRQTNLKETLNTQLLDELTGRYAGLLQGISKVTGGKAADGELTQAFRQDMSAMLQLPVMSGRFPLPSSHKYSDALEYLHSGLDETPALWITLFAWAMLHNLGKLSGQDGFEEQVRAWMDDWSLGRLIVDTAIEMGIQDQDAWQIVATVKLLDSYQAWFDHSSGQSVSIIFENWLKDSEIQRFMGLNRFKDVLWFNRESAEHLAWWMFFLAVFQAGSDRERSASDVVERTIRAHAWIEKFLTAISQSEYQLEKLLALLHTPSEAPIEDASSN